MDSHKPVLALDVDGVVVLGHPEGGRWYRHLARDLGIDPVRLQQYFFEPHWHRIEIGEADLFDVLREAWPRVETDATPESFVAYWFAQDSRLNVELLPAVDDWRASGGRAFLATVQEHHRARYLWTTLGLSTRFDGMLYSAALGAKKPQPDFFARAMERLPVQSADEVVLLDDLPLNVEAARRFGWRAYLYTAPGDLTRALGSGRIARSDSPKAPS